MSHDRAAGDPPVIEARGVTRVLQTAVPVTLVKDVNITVDRGELTAIVGPSGSGKSSLLYLLGLLDHPSEGSVFLEGVDTAQLEEHELAELRLEKLGFVFQFHFLLAEFSALHNVMIPMRKLGRLGHRAMRDRAKELLSTLGLDDAFNKSPGQLSGGMRQRVAVARALANDPLVILADEPTGNLDQKSGRNVFDIFERLVDDMNKTVITVTHDRDLAARTHRQIRIVDGRIDNDTNHANTPNTDRPNTDRPNKSGAQT